VLLRIPDLRDCDFRVLQPIRKKGFESDPDLSDPNPQIPQQKICYSSYNSRRTDKRAKKHEKQQQQKLRQKSPKFAKFQAILGVFYLATKIRILTLKNPTESGSGSLSRGIRSIKGFESSRQDPDPGAEAKFVK
jgi:hypothetical protein